MTGAQRTAGDQERSGVSRRDFGRLAAMALMGAAAAGGAGGCGSEAPPPVEEPPPQIPLNRGQRITGTGNVVTLTEDQNVQITPGGVKILPKDNYNAHGGEVITGAGSEMVKINFPKNSTIDYSGTEIGLGEAQVIDLQPGWEGKHPETYVGGGPNYMVNPVDGQIIVHPNPDKPHTLSLSAGDQLTLINSSITLGGKATMLPPEEGSVPAPSGAIHLRNGIITASGWT